jgi:hypothetical protein
MDPLSPRWRSDGGPSFYKNRAGDFLTSAHLRAIGRVVAEWSLLEYVLGAHGSALTNSRFPMMTGNPGGGGYADLLIALVEIPLSKHPKTAQKLIAALKRVQLLADERNAIVHCGWGNILEMKGRMAVISGNEVFSWRFTNRGRVYRSKSYSTTDIRALAKKISDVRVEINKIMFTLPRTLGGVK